MCFRLPVYPLIVAFRVSSCSAKVCPLKPVSCVNQCAASLPRHTQPYKTFLFSSNAKVGRRTQCWFVPLPPTLTCFYCGESADGAVWAQDELRVTSLGGRVDQTCAVTVSAKAAV